MGRTDASLIETLQRIIERTYDLETGLSDIGRFVIGDAGYRRLYSGLAGSGRILEKVGSAGAGARLLLRETSDALAVSLYYPDHLIECLERHDPTRRLDDRNVDAFATLVEELDHLLVVAEGYRLGRAHSLLDLELHANVTKYLVLQLFVGKLRGRRRLGDEDAAWIRFHLFDKVEFAEADPDVRARYRDAGRLAWRYLKKFDSMPPAGRAGELRRFHRLAPQARIAHCLNQQTC